MPGVIGSVININDPNYEFEMDYDRRELSPSKYQLMQDSAGQPVHANVLNNE